MGAGGERLHELLEGYIRRLIEKGLSRQKERPCLGPLHVPWPASKILLGGLGSCVVVRSHRTLAAPGQVGPLLSKAV